MHDPAERFRCAITRARQILDLQMRVCASVGHLVNYEEYGDCGRCLLLAIRGLRSGRIFKLLTSFSTFLFSFPYERALFPRTSAGSSKKILSSTRLLHGFVFLVSTHFVFMQSSNRTTATWTSSITLPLNTSTPSTKDTLGSPRSTSSKADETSVGFAVFVACVALLSLWVVCKCCFVGEDGRCG